MRVNFLLAVFLILLQSCSASVNRDAGAETGLRFSGQGECALPGPGMNVFGCD